MGRRRRQMRISRLLTFPRVLLWAGALSLLLALPTLSSGFILDDYSILSIIEERYPDRATSFNLYGPLIDYVDVPWWTSAELEIAFFRPLSSALLRFDYRVAGRTPWVYYLHSLVWLVALLGISGALYSRYPGRAATVAFVIFALDEFHSFTTGWISNRHAMVSLTLGLVGLWGHLRWREDSWRPGLPVAILGFVAALTAGEVGIAMVGYAVAFELAGSPKGSPSIGRWQALTYLATIAAAYALFYRSMGFGSSGGGAYLDPVGEPWIFLTAAVQRIPALLAGALAGVPPDAWMTETARPWLVGIGWAAVVATATLLRAGGSKGSDGHRRTLHWLALGAFFALVPVVATAPGHRQLAAPMVGLAFVLGFLVDAALQLWQHAGRARRLIAGAALGLLVLAHVVVAPLMRLAMQSNLMVLDRAVLSIVLPIVPESSEVAPKRWILANAPDFLTLFYGPAIYDYYRPAGAPLLETWDVLSAAPHAHRLTRTGPQTLEIEVINGQMLTTSLEKVWPPDRPFVTGDIVPSRNFEAEILEVADVGPTRVRFRFHDSLDRRELGLLLWGTEGLQEAPMPGIGESLMLPYVASPVRFPGTT